MALRQKQAVICFDIVDGRSFLTADMSIRCDAEYQQLIYPLAAIAFLFYALGIPAILFLRLRMYRRMLQSPAAEFMLGFLYKVRLYDALSFTRAVVMLTCCIHVPTPTPAPGPT